MKLIPRPYQNRMANSWFDYYESGGKANSLLLGAPTGTGKSIIPAMIIQRCLKPAPYSRHLICTHVKELIQQNFIAARRTAPTMPMGICSAGLNLFQPEYQIVFGGIATMHKRIKEIGYRDTMFIDEAHMAGDAEGSMYQEFIAGLRKINPRMKVIGLSATLFRMGQGLLTEGDSALFDEVCLDMTTMEEFCYFLDEHYLSPLTPRATQTEFDVSEVRTGETDFIQSQLADAFSKESVMRKALEEAIELSRDRKKILVFGAGIENCYRIKEYLAARGIPAGIVHSNTTKFPSTKDERDNTIDAFKKGYLRVIINNNILTTGFDEPGIDAIWGLRATTSINLNVQMWGRGTRPVFHPQWNNEMLQDRDQRAAAIQAGSKPNGCLALDFAANIKRCGTINNPKRPKRRGEGGGDAPQKICEKCGAFHHPTVKACDICGTEFTFRVKIQTKSSKDELITFVESTIDILTVDQWECAIHRKAGKANSLKVTYWCQMRPFSTYLGFDSPKGYPKKKAHDWWRQHFGDDMPTDVNQAYSWFSKCRMATKVKIDLTDRFPSIKEYYFE